MASPTPTAEEVQQLVSRAHAAAWHARTVRGQYRRRSHPGDALRRQELEQEHARLLGVAEELRRERIRAARDKQFGTLYGRRLCEASDAVKRERYSVYRMLNPGGHKWRQQ